MASVARECSLSSRVAEEYFRLVEDLLLGVRIPVFQKRAKRKTIQHPKFFFFDAGVFRTLRPLGPLDEPATATGPAVETLVLEHLRAYNDAFHWGYSIHYWRTTNQNEVDFILYGKGGLHAIEVKSSSRLKEEDFAGLRAFQEDYPIARCTLLYGGTRKESSGTIDIVPLAEGLRRLPRILEP